MDDHDSKRQLITQIIAAGQRLTRMTHLVQQPEEWLNLDVTIPQMKVLMYLYLGGEMNMARLATILGTKLPSVTGLVDRLVERGLVQRADSPDDRRLVLASITGEGRATLDRLWEAGWLCFDRLLEQTSIDDLHVVSQAMVILMDAASRHFRENTSLRDHELAGIIHNYPHLARNVT